LSDRVAFTLYYFPTLLLRPPVIISLRCVSYLPPVSKVAFVRNFHKVSRSHQKMADKAVALASLSVQDLARIKQQVEESLADLGGKREQLLGIIARFRSSKDVLTQLCPANKGKTVMVPLTPTLFVQGTLGNTESVFVDIGTGYSVEKSIPEAANYLNRQIKFVQQQVEDTDKAVQEKRKVREAVVMVLQQKITESAVKQQHQQQVAAKS